MCSSSTDILDLFLRLKKSNANIHSFMKILSALSKFCRDRDELLEYRESISSLRVDLSELGTALQAIFIKCAELNITTLEVITEVEGETELLLQSVQMTQFSNWKYNPKYQEILGPSVATYMQSAQQQVTYLIKAASSSMSDIVARHIASGSKSPLNCTGVRATSSVNQSASSVVSENQQGVALQKTEGDETSFVSDNILDCDYENVIARDMEVNSDMSVGYSPTRLRRVGTVISSARSAENSSPCSSDANILGSTKSRTPDVLSQCDNNNTGIFALATSELRDIDEAEPVESIESTRDIVLSTSSSSSDEQKQLYSFRDKIIRRMINFKAKSPETDTVERLVGCFVDVMHRSGLVEVAADDGNFLNAVASDFLTLCTHLNNSHTLPDANVLDEVQSIREVLEMESSLLQDSNSYTYVPTAATESGSENSDLQERRSFAFLGLLGQVVGALIQLIDTLAPSASSEDVDIAQTSGLCAALLGERARLWTDRDDFSCADDSFFSNTVKGSSNKTNSSLFGEFISSFGRHAATTSKLSELALSANNFDLNDISKRPAGWRTIRSRRVRALEQQDRDRNVPESTIMLRRPRRVVEVTQSELSTQSGKSVENEMIKEAGVLEKIKTFELKAATAQCGTKPVFPTSFHAKASLSGKQACERGTKHSP